MGGHSMTGKEKPKKVFTMYGKYSDVVTYSYKGSEYDVEYSKCWTYCTTPAHIQHQDAQRRIDEVIENEKKPKIKQDIQAALDEFFEIMES